MGLETSHHEGSEAWNGIAALEEKKRDFMERISRIEDASEAWEVTKQELNKIEAAEERGEFVDPGYEVFIKEKEAEARESVLGETRGL